MSGIVSPPRLYICTACRRPKDDESVEPTPGRLLYDAVVALARADGGGRAVEPIAVTCLASCERGCTATVAAPDKKWAYMVGGLGPDHAADLIVYAGLYAGSATGSVARADRPASLRSSILGRFPNFTGEAGS